jgi:hypothetical protein
VVDGVRAVIPAHLLEGILLGGGYGRGEGGVLSTPSGDQPYNDLEFYIFVRGNAVLAERRWHAALHGLGEELSPEAGLEVEFKVMTRRKLRCSGPSMFYYDLVMGHRRCLGGEALLDGCEHHRDARRIPLHEATRLLMNRCSGLLFSSERLARKPFADDDADFVGRNLAKAQLAFGDVVLTAQGQYDWSCQRRDERLRQLPTNPSQTWLKSVQRHHLEGVQFKLHPIRSRASRETLATQHQELVEIGRSVWLWLESLRLSHVFASPRIYALSRVNKCPETSTLKNGLLQLRHFGLDSFRGRGSGLRYPRQRLFHALCWLLWEPDTLDDPEALARVQEELHTKDNDLPGLVRAFQHIWNRFN